ncbi:MAG TPA: Rieske 2Fe-2S domain-containing protein [Vicinamibacterales bacterium]
MSETRWVRAACTEHVPLREGREVLIGPLSLALFNLGHRYLAVDNQCPHKGGPLADGIVTGTSVVCPLHSWRISLETGDVDRPASGRGRCVHAYPTRVEDGVVSIEIPVARLGTPSQRAEAPAAEPQALAACTQSKASKEEAA